MVRQATKEEIATIVGESDHMDVLWAGVVEEDGQIAGHAFLSRINGALLIHDLRYEGASPTAVAELLLGLRAHHEQVAPGQPQLAEVKPGSGSEKFLQRRGFQTVSHLMQGNL